MVQLSYAEGCRGTGRNVSAGWRAGCLWARTGSLVPRVGAGIEGGAVREPTDKVPTGSKVLETRTPE